MSLRFCVWLLFSLCLSMIMIDCMLQYQDPAKNQPAEVLSLVRILTIENSINYPVYHTALELSYPGFKETYGFYSTYSSWRFWLYGWMAHQGLVRKPDIFTMGSPGSNNHKYVPPGVIKSPLISFYLNRNQTMVLLEILQKEIINPGDYSYINRARVNNCASWVESVINPVISENRLYLDCSEALCGLSLPSNCQLKRLIG